MTILVADAGGTHIRFAYAREGGELSEPQKYKVADFPTLDDAIIHFLFSARVETDDITCFYYSYGGKNPWDAKGVAHTLPQARLRVINDFEANAYGIIGARVDDVICLAGDAALPRSARPSRAVIGSGTGVGLAYIISSPQGDIVQPTHGAHMLPATLSDNHRALFAAVQRFKKTPSATIYEDLLSGPSILNLYKVLCAQAHVDVEYGDTHDLIARGRHDPMAQQTLKIYHEILGIFAHQVLAFGHSYGGLYLTGGITDRLMALNLFDRETFLANLYQDNVPIVKNDVAATPVYWVKDEYISLRGLLAIARQGV